MPALHLFIPRIINVGCVLRTTNYSVKRFIRLRPSHHEMLILFEGFAKRELGEQGVPKPELGNQDKCRVRSLHHDGGRDARPAGLFMVSREPQAHERLFQVW